MQPQVRKMKRMQNELTGKSKGYTISPKLCIGENNKKTRMTHRNDTIIMMKIFQSLHHLLSKLHWYTLSVYSTIMNKTNPLPLHWSSIKETQKKYW